MKNDTRGSIDPTDLISELMDTEAGQEHASNSKGRSDVGYDASHPTQTDAFSSSIWRKLSNTLSTFILSAWLLRLLLLISTIVVVIEYNSNQYNKTIEASLDVISSWDTLGYADDFRTIALEVKRIQNQARDDLISDFSGQELDQMMENAVQNGFIEIQDRNLFDAVDRTFFFFEKAGLCGIKRICDLRLLQEFFGSAARSFIFYNEEYINRRRIAEPSFAQYIEMLGRDSINGNSLLGSFFNLLRI